MDKEFSYLGSKIHYVERGKGAHATLCIHNAGGSSQFFEKQMPLFAKYGRAIAMDLPGHGLSPPNTKVMTKAAIAELILAFQKHLGIEELTLCGLNNGANIALRTKVDRYILLDPILKPDPSFTEEIKKLIDQFQRAPKVLAKEIAHALTLESMIKERQMAEQAFMKVDGATMVSLLEELIQQDDTAAYQALDKEALIILSDEHHVTYETASKYRGKKTTIGKVVNANAWSPLTAPDQIAAMVRAFMPERS